MATPKELMIKIGIREDLRDCAYKPDDRPFYGYIKSNGGNLSSM